MRDLRADETAWLGGDFTGRFSLAGAQAKTALYHDNGRWGLPIGSAATSHILKPAISGFDDHDLNEHLCLRAAALTGLPAVRSEIVSFGNETAIQVERYDRIRTGRTLTRIHQEDACQALGVTPTGKYQTDGGPSPADIAALFRRTMPAQLANAAVRQFTDALLWNWVIAGTDAHAKNYSLLLSGSQVRLAPLYDVASALPYGTHERKLRLAMKLGNDYRLHDPRPSIWPVLARQLGLNHDQLVDQAARLIDAVAARAKRCRTSLPS